MNRFWLATPTLLSAYFDDGHSKGSNEVDISISSEFVGNHLKNTGSFRDTTHFIAKLHGGDGAILSAHGTTFNIQVIFQYLRLKYGVGAKILVASNSHVSVINAARLFRLRLRFIPVKFLGRFEAVLPPSSEDVAKSIRTHPDACAVLIVSPTYDGLYANIAKIAKVCRRAGVLLIVDGAWSHLPEKPLDEGAGVFLKSTHKMDGSLQGGAILVYKDEEVNEDMLWDSYRRLVSTSPSFKILANIDWVYDVLTSKPSLLKKPSCWITEVKHLLSERGVDVLSEEYIQDLMPHTVKHLEDWKIQVALPVNGYALKRKLEENFGIIAEKAGLKHVQFIGAWRTIKRLKPETFASLLYSTTEELMKTYESDNNYFLFDTCSYNLQVPFINTKEIIYEVYKVDDMTKELLPIEKAVDRVAAETVIPYPPGSPIIVPGAKVTEEDKKYVNFLSGVGGEIVCSRKGYVEVIS
jgi:arginine/lysine/ornithine decarboxylase